MPTKNTLTAKELKELQEYLDGMEELAAQEPQHLEESLSPEEYQQASDYILLGKGEPPACIDRFGISEITDADGIKHKVFYDKELENWRNKEAELNNKYSKVIAKALTVSISDWKDNPQSVADILKAFLSDNPKEKAESLNALHTQLTSVSKYGLMNDKANRELISDLPTTRDIDGQLNLVWGIDQSAPDKSQVPVIVSLSYEGGQITTSKRITSKDEAVFTAAANIITLLKQSGAAAPYYITPQDIWRRMNGIKGNRKSPTKKQLKEVCDSIDKMRFTRLYMDISQEINANYIKLNDSRLTGGIIEDYYLPAKKVEFYTEKGQTVTGYRIDETPFLYSYNIAKGHAILVDYDLLDTSDTTGNEGYTVEFRNYLLREIGLMYKQERNSTKILYSTIYKAAAIPTPEERTNRSKYKSDAAYTSNIKKAAANDRNKIMALLDSWVNKNWILGYTQTKSGRAYSGIEIKLNPKNYENPQEKETKKIAAK